MYKLKNNETNEVIGLINQTQLQFLIDQLEEESIEDQDYRLDRDLLDTFRENGADIELLRMLEIAFGTNNELEVFWEKSGM
jgi:hypothetical protein